MDLEDYIPFISFYLLVSLFFAVLVVIAGLADAAAALFSAIFWKEWIGCGWIKVPPGLRSIVARDTCDPQLPPRPLMPPPLLIAS